MNRFGLCARCANVFPPTILLWLRRANLNGSSQAGETVTEIKTPVSLNFWLFPVGHLDNAANVRYQTPEDGATFVFLPTQAH